MSATASLHKRIATAAFNTVNTAVSFLKIGVMSKQAPKLPQANHSRCIVLGNGPSLSNLLAEHPSHFTSCSLIAVNGFALADDYKKLQPRYYVLLDPGIWLAESTWINDMLRAISDNTSWELHLMIPHQAKGTGNLAILKQNQQIRIHFINYVVYKGWNGPGFYFWKRNKAMPQCQNVLVAALFLAINIGYKEIELAGADHNWHETLAMTDDNVVCLKHVHFYDKQEQISYRPFYKTAATKETFRMDEIFHAWARVFHGYWRIKEYAAYRGARIVNISNPSFVDAFERKKLN
ncbi:MAG: hypothetical protein ACKOSR_15245 [Flavobacteriales bacterium]